MKSINTLRLTFLGLFALLTTYSVRGQGFIDITAGVGFPELVNFGLRLQMEQSQLGFYWGTFPGADDKVFTLGADYYYHFSGVSKLSNRKPWFIKTGLNYFHDENDFIRKTSFFLVPKIGRDLNLSRKIGIGLESGPFLLLSHSEVKKKARESPCLLCEGGFVSIGPSFGLSVFYRL